MPYMPQWYHDPVQLQKSLDQHGSWAALSKATGVAVSTLKQSGAKLDVKRSGRKLAAPQLGEVVSREEILEAENTELRKVVSSARKAEVFDARALQLLESSIAAKIPEFSAVALPKDKDMTTHRFVLELSDIHAAERVSYVEMNGLNEFNWAIMLERLARMQRAVLSFLRNRPYPVDDLYILGLGDQVTGDIHDELRETNELVCTESAVQLGLDLSEFIAGFAPYFRHIYLDGVVGNHGRTTKKPEFKQPQKNWDWIVYKIIELRLAEFDNITVRVPSSFETIVEVFDRKILCFHGDGVPTNMPGVPWGGVQRRTKELADTWAAMGFRIDHFALGHFHEANVVGQKRIWMNGSVKGPDEFSKKRYGGGRPAQQLLLTMHPKRGLTDVSFLDLQ